MRRSGVRSPSAPPTYNNMGTVQAKVETADSVDVSSGLVMGTVKYMSLAVTRTTFTSDVILISEGR